MTTHSRILAWRILWTDEPGGTVHGVIKSWTPLNTYTHVIRFRKTQKIQGRKKSKLNQLSRNNILHYMHMHILYMSVCMYLNAFYFLLVFIGV